MYGWRGKIGLIVPSNNTLIEPELYPRLPKGVSLHAAKILTEGSDADSIIEMVKKAERAGLELSAGNVDLIAYCCLSTSLIKGMKWNKEFTVRLAELTGCPVITAFDATVEGLKELNISKISLVSPYPKKVHELLVNCFADEGIQILSEVNTPIEDINEVPNVSPYHVYSLVRKAFAEQSEGICIVATDLPTLSIIQVAEKDLGKPVITTNQAILNVALKKMNVKY